MFRRLNGVTQDDSTSPSKEELRRRLFETPQKNSKAKRKGDTALLHIPIAAIFIFVAFGVVLLLGVHGYLLQTLLSPEMDSASTPAIAPVETLDLAPTNVLRRRPAPLPKRKLQPLEEKDWNQYTIRINTWRRPEQLLVSVDWHSQCPGVAQIQIVWCDHENEPPAALEDYDNVVIERHEANSLNERFNILIPPPTLGILSIDDDVLRPCEAIDAGFFKWTESPDRMVGFDGRLHVENDDGSWEVCYALRKTGKAYVAFIIVSEFFIPCCLSIF